MTLDDFKNKYLGKQVEYHSFGSGALNQCVDLVNRYIVDVLKREHIIGTNAKDFKDRFNADQFDFIPNSPMGVPSKGDIVIWNGRVGGGAGHVGIFLEGDVNSFKSLDQNWSQKERVTLENHNYTNVSGWLTPKGGDTIDNKDLEICRIDRDLNWNVFNKVMEAIGVEADSNDKNASAESAIKAIAQFKKTTEDVRAIKKELETTKEAYEKRISTLNQLLTEKQELIDRLQSTPNENVDLLKEQIKAKDNQIEGMAKQIQELEAGQTNEGCIEQLVHWIKGLWK